MQRTLIGAVAAILLMLGGFLIWQGHSATPQASVEGLPPPEADMEGPVLALPEGDPTARGAPPPALPEATRISREERRFMRYDRDRSGVITRLEMLSTRTAAFRRLDRDGNNLLSFEEWAVATADRFGGADADRSGGLSRSEFATTAPPARERSACRC